MISLAAISAASLAKSGDTLQARISKALAAYPPFGIGSLVLSGSYVPPVRPYINLAVLSRLPPAAPDSSVACLLMVIPAGNVILVSAIEMQVRHKQWNS